MKSILSLFILAFSLFSTPVFSQSVGSETQIPQFQYRESDIGIDYRALAESPLAEMLSLGEVEFLENATSVFGEETAIAWQETAKEIGTGSVSEYTIEAMKEFTPLMLSSFSQVPAESTKYRSLGIIGLLFNSEGFLPSIKDK